MVSVVVSVCVAGCSCGSGGGIGVESIAVSVVVIGFENKAAASPLLERWYPCEDCVLRSVGADGATDTPVVGDPNTEAAVLLVTLLPLPLRSGEDDDANDCGATVAGSVVAPNDAAIPEGGGDMNVVVADGVIPVVVFKDDNIGVLAGVFPMNELGDEKVLAPPVFDPLNGAGGIVNDTDDDCVGSGILFPLNAGLKG